MRTVSLHRVFVLCCAAGVLSSRVGISQEREKSSRNQQHIVATLDSVTWTPIPNIDGLAIAVLEGDPNVNGSNYTIWVRAKEGTPGGIVPYHWHPTDERITVLRGVMGVSMADLFDMAKGREYASGSFVMLPALMRHSAWVRGETIMQVSGVGPFVTCIVNPSERRGEQPAVCSAENRR